MDLLLWVWDRPYWQLTTAVAVLSAIAWLFLRRRDSPLEIKLTGFTRDLAIAAGVFAVYQHTVHLARMHVAGATDHALAVVDIERWMRLPSELDLQQLVLPHPLLVKLLNGYYAGVHLPLMICFALWVLWFHRDGWPAVRNVIAVSTLACVLIQMYPVAPPRLMPELGYVDTAVAYGQSVYGAGGGEIAGQLAAMPSIHIAWAAIIAWYAVRLSTSPWRWVFVAHLVMTVVVITATANHWWLDGIVAIGIVALAILAQTGLERRFADRAQRAVPARASVGATAQ